MVSYESCKSPPPPPLNGGVRENILAVIINPYFVTNHWKGFTYKIIVRDKRRRDTQSLNGGLSKITS